jgi:hypothetical protein
VVRDRVTLRAGPRYNIGGSVARPIVGDHHTDPALKRRTELLRHAGQRVSQDRRPAVVGRDADV